MPMKIINTMRICSTSEGKHNSSVIQTESLMRTEYPFKFCKYASRALMIFLTGTEDSLYGVVFTVEYLT